MYIVHSDWFEFSAVENNKLSEREYSLRNLKAKQRSKERERVREQLRQEKGKRDGEQVLNTCELHDQTPLVRSKTKVFANLPTSNFQGLFHIYRDRANFAYQIDITRNDESTGEVGQRYELCVSDPNYDSAREFH